MNFFEMLGYSIRGWRWSDTLEGSPTAKGNCFKGNYVIKSENANKDL